MQRIKNLIVHWSVSPPNTKVADIIRWHKEAGKRTIGYHRVIENEAVNSIKKGVKVKPMDLVKQGRELNNDVYLDKIEIGAHTFGRNHTSVGICVVGSPQRPPSPLQCEALYQTLEILRGRFKLNRGDVLGHGEAHGQATECPGVLLRRFLDLYRKAQDWPNISKLLFSA